MMSACTKLAVVNHALLSGLGGSRDGGGREVDADLRCLAVAAGQ